MRDFSPIDCPFCWLPPERIIDSNAHALIVADAFPVAPGHKLVILRRHVASFFEATTEEIAAVYELLHRAKYCLDQTLMPAGYNIGVNVGVAAGQTIEHAHVHLIPRYPDDTPDPIGGVRNVLPGKGTYGTFHRRTHHE
jgi:diadenosine tetraphosphate (Ap4A) HIT family hydrolase